MACKYPRRMPSVCACGEQAFVLGTQGRTIIFDPDDLDIVSPYNWTTNKDESGPAYATRGTTGGGSCRKIRMHRELMGAPRGLLVDHRNGDTMDNRRRNLRVATRGQNMQNARGASNSISGLKGVTPDGSKWKARIKQYHLGHFETKEAAALAYDAAARKLFGEFAKTNFPVDAQSV